MNQLTAHASAPQHGTAAHPPILNRAEATRRTELLAQLQRTLAALGIDSVLARHHRLVLRNGTKPREPSGPTNPELHVFTLRGTVIAATDGTSYIITSGGKGPAGDPAATAAFIARDHGHAPMA